MGAEALSSRAVIGWYYLALEETMLASWAGDVSMLMQSDQMSEEYNWLGQVPMLREWLGERLAKGLSTKGITIKNLEFEATLEFLRREMRLDKSSQIRVRIGELADRAIQHWAKLLSTLIETGTTALCYDGQAYFDTDHSEGTSGTQDNDLAKTVAAQTGPTVAEMEDMILTAIQAILGYKDDVGEPMNDMGKKFLVMVPTGYLKVAAPAISNQVIQSGATSRDSGVKALKDRGFTIDLAVNPRLTAPGITTGLTGAFYVWRTDGRVKPLIRQEEEQQSLDVLAEGSEQEVLSKRHIYGVKATRNVGFGYWQHAALMTVTNA